MSNFDPFEFVPLFGPVQKVRSDQYAFARAGRDLGEFSPLLAFGNVRGEGDRVILTLSKQQQALAGKVARNERKIASTERDAREVKGSVRRLSAALASSRTTRRLGLGGGPRITDEGGLKLGPVSMGRGGFTMDKGSLKNVSGTAFRTTIGIGLAAAAGNLLGEGANSYLDAIEATRKAIQSGQSLTGIYRRTVRNKAGSAVVGFAEYFGASKLAKAALRLNGQSSEEADEVIAGQIERMILAAEQRREIVTNRQVAMEAAAREVRKAYEQLWEKISTHQPISFMLRGKREYQLYQRDIQRVNRSYFEKQRKAAIETAKRDALAASMGGI